MRSKIILASIILLGLVFLAMTARVSPDEDVAAQLEQAKAIVKEYITSDKDTEADDAYQKLLADFSDNERITQAVYEIAETYRHNDKFKQSLQAYQDVVTKWPASSEAVWAQRGVAISSIALNKMDAAQVAVDKLLADYSENANIAEAVFNVADTYYWFKHYEKANELYQYVLDTWPSAEHAMWAQMGLAISNIAVSNDSAAEIATENLIANFSNNPKLPEALFYIAGRYGWDKKYDQAKTIYQQIIQNWPDNSFADSAQFELAKANIFSFIHSQDEPNALIAIDKFISDFNDRPDLPAALYDIAGRYNQPAELIETVYQQVVELFPESSFAGKAPLNISRLNIISLINSGDDPNAFIAIDTLITDFNNHPDLPGTIFAIGEQYYNKAFRCVNEDLSTEANDYFRKAVTALETIVQKLPPSAPYTPRACRLVAYGYYRLGEYHKAIEYGRKVVDNWPDYELASWTELVIDRCLKQLEKSVSDPE